MTTRSRSTEVDAYLTGVAAALADLPADDRQDLLDEVGTHLNELSHETDAPLESRLGTPADYAAELRASAGLSPAPNRLTGVTGIADRLRSGWAQPRVLVVREFLAALRPVWWVLRGWAIVGVIAILGWQPAWSSRLIVVPFVGDGTTGLWLTLAVIVASVQVGRGRWRWPGRRVVLAVNVAAALAVAPLMVSLENASQNTCCDRWQTIVAPPAHGVYARGERVTNIYTYDSAGKLVTDIRMYDQHGRPLDLQIGRAANRRVLFDSTGVAVQNTYPIRYFERGTRTVTDLSAAPAIVVPPLVAQPLVTPTPTPTSSPSVSKKG